MSQIVNNKFLLNYTGEINYDNIGVMLSELKRKMDEHGFRLGAYKKVLTVLVECLENIYKYSSNAMVDQSVLQDHPPYFSLQPFDGYFILKAGNPLFEKDKVKLKSKIEGINALDADGLKSIYKKIITDGKFTDKGGAGLGFIEMVKTTGNKIDFTFDPLNPEYSYFHITLKIPVT
jgi:hypothetical protein